MNPNTQSQSWLEVAISAVILVGLGWFALKMLGVI